MPDAANEFGYFLPPELIAQDPPEHRGDSRLLLVGIGCGVLGEHPFGALPGLLRAGDLLVLNESRVFPARLLTRRLDTGGRVEILLVGPEPGLCTWRALARPARRLRPGLLLAPEAPFPGEALPPPPPLEVLANLGEGEVLLRCGIDPGLLAEDWGVMPLPPYIKRDLGDGGDRARLERDRRRYQTVYARDDRGGGSVAAPTAGLHFSQEVLRSLGSAGIGLAKVSLHVGPGTFRSPDPGQIAARRLHPERFVLPAAVWREMDRVRKAGGRVIAVGTTSLRVLETVARLGLDPHGGGDREFGAGPELAPPEFTGRAVYRKEGWEVTGITRLFIRPPDRITAAQGLLTNFHLPGSSLLMLVAALLGDQWWRPVYQEAVARRMRFFSYGDCMLILPSHGDLP